jgi:thiamine-monophosphate kinase
VLGTARDALTRSGAKPGDGVYVTGRLGGPWAALQDLQSGRQPTDSNRERFAHPVPRILESAWLEAKGATSAIDISDGLLADARHLASASGVMLTIDALAVPRTSDVNASDALSSGEEYELLVAMPRSFGTPGARAFRRATGLQLTRIGRCEVGRGVRMTDNGKRITPPSGFDHFPAR